MARQRLIINLTEPKQLSHKAFCLLEQYKALLNALGHHVFREVATAQVVVTISKGEFESLTFRIQNIKLKHFILVEVSFITGSFRILGSNRFNRRLVSKNTVEKLCFLTEEIGGINHA